MSRKFALAVVCVIIGVLAAWVAGAAFPGLRSSLFPAPPPPVPAVISYQGLLTDSAGEAVTGSKSMLFSVYDEAGAITPLWSETACSTSSSETSRHYPTRCSTAVCFISESRSMRTRR
jgi:hypothetical protein